MAGNKSKGTGAGRSGRSTGGAFATLNSGQPISVKTPGGVVSVTPNDFFAGSNVSTKSFQTFTLKTSAGKKIATIDRAGLKDWLSQPGVARI